MTTLTMAFLTNGYSVKYVPIEYRKRSGRSKFHWLADTRRYILQVVRMILMHEPIRFFGPIAGWVGTVGGGKLIWDVTTKNFRVASNTIVMLGVAFALAGIGLLADLLVQLNKRDYSVLPATRE
nr:MAG: hypothetical protein DIU67_11395 [Actinomycetota bacterium]